MTRVWNSVLTGLALVFLIAYSYPALNESISDSTQLVIDSVQWICWLAFAIDLVYGIWTSKDKKIYLRQHPLDIAAVILPFLRPLRLM